MNVYIEKTTWEELPTSTKQALNKAYDFVAEFGDQDRVYLARSNSSNRLLGWALAQQRRTPQFYKEEEEERARIARTIHVDYAVKGKHPGLGTQLLDIVRADLKPLKRRVVYDFVEGLNRIVK